MQKAHLQAARNERCQDDQATVRRYLLRCQQDKDVCQPWHLLALYTHILKFGLLLLFMRLQNVLIPRVDLQSCLGLS